MAKTTHQLAQELIAAEELLPEQYLEMRHLDPPLIVAIHIRLLALRHALRSFNLDDFSYRSSMSRSRKA